MTASLLTASGFCERLAEELAVELPVAKLSGEAPALDFVFAWVDGVVRQVGAAGLVAQGRADAGLDVQRLPPVHDDASARSTMMALEKIGRKHQAPSAFMRALGGAPSTLLLLARVAPGDEERTEAVLTQILLAGVRVVGMCARAGVPGAELTSRVTQAFVDGAGT